jgi:uncharacterized membrane protein (DUF106 family)
MGLFEAISVPPWSALAILLISMGMSTLTAFITRKVTDQAKLRRYRQEISDWRKMSVEAQKTKDEKMALEAKRRSKIIQRMQQEVAKQSFKPMLVYIIPFIVIWAILGGFYGGRIVALLPYDLGLVPVAGPMVGSLINKSVFGLGLFGWYLFCNFSFGMMINRIFGVRLSTGTSL